MNTESQEKSTPTPQEAASLFGRIGWIVTAAGLRLVFALPDA
jgi:hypothetical protein